MEADRARDQRVNQRPSSTVRSAKDEFSTRERARLARRRERIHPGRRLRQKSLQLVMVGLVRPRETPLCVRNLALQFRAFLRFLSRVAATLFSWPFGSTPSSSEASSSSSTSGSARPHEIRRNFSARLRLPRHGCKLPKPAGDSPNHWRYPQPRFDLQGYRAFDNYRVVRRLLRRQSTKVETWPISRYSRLRVVILFCRVDEVEASRGLCRLRGQRPSHQRSRETVGSRR